MTRSKNLLLSKCKIINTPQNCPKNCQKKGREKAIMSPLRRLHGSRLQLWKLQLRSQILLPWRHWTRPQPGPTASFFSPQNPGMIDTPDREGPIHRHYRLAKRKVIFQATYVNFGVLVLEEFDGFLQLPNGGTQMTRKKNTPSG